MELAAEATAPAVVAAQRPSRPKRHRLEENPPPPLRVLTLPQVEEANPGLRGRMRDWVKRAYADDPDFAWLKFCIIRIGRSLYIDEVRFRDSLHQRTALPPAPARNPEGKTRIAAKREVA